MTVYAVAPGAKFATQRRVEFKDLTAEMVRSGEWAGKDVKPYNWNALGTPVEWCVLPPCVLAAFCLPVLCCLGCTHALDRDLAAAPCIRS